ncbi:MAG: hypothetical protein QW139_01750, partial [Candidatus Micrarchaeaceae archaeon]
MEYSSAQSGHLPSESFKRWFATIPLLENLNHIDLLQNFAWPFAFMILRWSAASYSMPISKHNIPYAY